MSTTEKSVHDGHRQRLRERYEQNGTDGFSDHELLELLLSYSIQRKDTNSIGHALVERFGDLRGVLNADPEELEEVEGIGDYSAFLLNFIRGIAHRYFEESGNHDLNFSSTKRMIEFFKMRFVGCKNERLYAAFLDENYNLIYCEKQYDGSASQVEIHGPRIMRAAQRCGCRYVLLAHNHFSDTTPSTADVNTTNALFQKLQTVGVTLVDHIIICGANGESMRAGGYLADIICEQ